MDQYGAVIILPYSWGEVYNIPYGAPRSILVVQMPSSNASGASQPYRVRVDEVYCHLYEGDQSHPLTIALNFPSYSVPIVEGGFTTSGGGLTQSALAATLNLPSTTIGAHSIITPLLLNSSVTAQLLTATTPIASSPVSLTVNSATIANVVGAFGGTGSGQSPFTVGFTAGSGGYIMQYSTPAFNIAPAAPGSLVDNTPQCLTRVACCLYVGVQTVGGNYTVKDPSNNQDAVYDFLDLATDVFLVPFGHVDQYTGRKWVLRLPHPIELGVGEALIMTLSVVSTCTSDMNLVPYIRSRIVDLV
jgi:hypothetical protein